MRAMALLLPFAFAACVEGTVSPDPGMTDDPLPPATGCGAPELQYLVGQSETILQRMKFANRVRIIHPGMAVTMDYSADRLNIEIDETGKIARVSCG